MAEQPYAIEVVAGAKIWRWTVLRRDGCTPTGQAMWLCRCECGGTHRVRGYALRQGNTRGCGKCRGVRHGHARPGHNTPEYRAWRNMICRCTRPITRGYALYGGRGIRVCERWFQFENFLADMGIRPSAKLSLDRIDNNGNYGPGNCRWATNAQQMANTRRNAFVTAFGRTQIISEWSREFGVHPDSIRSRIKNGVTPETAVSAPPGKLP